MKKRSMLILLVLVAIGAAGGLSLWKARRDARQREAAALPMAPAPVVAIQDGKTIDFSSGRAVVRDTAEDRAAIGAAIKEIDEAVKNVTFAPTAPAEQPAKK